MKSLVHSILGGQLHDKNVQGFFAYLFIIKRLVLIEIDIFLNNNQ